MPLSRSSHRIIHLKPPHCTAAAAGPPGRKSDANAHHCRRKKVIGDTGGYEGLQGDSLSLRKWGVLHMQSPFPVEDQCENIKGALFQWCRETEASCRTIEANINLSSRNRGNRGSGPEPPRLGEHLRIVRLLPDLSHDLRIGHPAVLVDNEHGPGEQAQLFDQEAVSLTELPFPII